MLFTSTSFAFIFLPLVLAGFFSVARWSAALAAAWLFMASLAFYAYWSAPYVLLLLASIVVNYAIGRRISTCIAGRLPGARGTLVAGLVFNLGLLAYYKYASFFVASISAATGLPLDVGSIVLPIGISFFTFTQIAFLVDTYRHGTREYRFLHYGLFVTYFPHLIAGPVLHHAQMMPQFGRPATYRPRLANLAAGLAIFGIGLVKKVALADGVAPFADAVFDGVAAGQAPSPNEAWLGALAYTYQLYFDFSGYSDMAIGLSLMLNVRLPWNFDSPYRSASIAEFWRRWHMTLSRFLRDYLYVPLGGNRRGELRRYGNLMATMLLGGLWHGANWTFVLWGGLHGLYLCANHAFRQAARRLRWKVRPSRAWAAAAWLTTFLCVVVAWVFFRATSVEAAWTIVTAMAGVVLPGTLSTERLVMNAGLSPTYGALACAALGLIAVLRPNSNLIGCRLRRSCRQRPQAAAAMLGASSVLSAFLVLLNAEREGANAFLYFNF